MGRKKNKQRKNKTVSNKVESNKNIQDVEISCEKPESSLDNEQLLRLETLSSTEKSVINNGGVSDTEAELIFETYRPNTERVEGREYFIHSLCQVCKEELNNRVLCPKCQLVSYCSQDHRRQHWPVHADLCRAIVEVCADRQADHIMHGSLHCSADEFRVFRFQNMVECEAKVGRPLDKWEREMFVFPNVCGTCHAYDPEHLVTCDRCRHSSFCKNHRTQSHSEWCEFLLRYKNIIKDQNKFGIVYPSVPRSKISLVPPKLQDIKQVFKGVLNYIDFFEFVELSEITTYPFTALNALLTRNENPQQKITLHVIGAEADFEINKPEKWEYYILHLIPGLQNLKIVFIGPELKPTAEQKAVTVCSKCKAAGKSMTLKFERELYHVFSKKHESSKPQLICVFNPGLYRMTGFNNADTWGPSLVSMFAQGCPVLTTAYTQREVLLDVQRVKQTLNIRLDNEPMLNPFSSLKPNLNFVSDEESPVIFKNQYYCVMCKA